MKELMNGTCILNEAGVAKKTSFGWKINITNGTKPFTSVRHRATPGEMTNIKFVETKREAREILKLLGDF